MKLSANGAHGTYETVIDLPKQALDALIFDKAYDGVEANQPLPPLKAMS